MIIFVFCMRLLVVFLISLIAAAQPDPRQEDSLRRAKMAELFYAADNYRLYSAESDSARIQDTHRQLNELTKKFELDELRMENEASRQRNTMLGLIVAVMAVLLVAIFVYNRQ